MNCGLSNATTIRNVVLHTSIASGTTYDSKIAQVGRSVLAQMNGYCNRRLDYNSAAVLVVSGERDTIALDHYPLKSVTSVEQRDPGTAWTTITSPVSNTDERNGVLYVVGGLGGQDILYRVTYAGGYWFDTADTGGADVMPSGATALPSDLLGLFLAQVAHVWRVTDKVGASITELPSEKSYGLIDTNLLPGVQTGLNIYRRMILL